MGIKIAHFILILLIFPCTSFATSSDLNKTIALQKLAIEKKLWLHREWLNLGHYYKKSLFPQQYYSQADDIKFFNADDGDSNPKSELLSTISAFSRTDITGDDHPQCRFIARLSWLRQHLPIDDNSFPAVKCKKYEQWHSLAQAEQVTMVFPTYHLNSPSSMFGHTLLRLDPAAEKKQSKWLSYAVNFGANADASDNSIFYAFKGLTGAYPGLFIVTPYFKKIREYNRIEKRDIWEYNLNLTPIEVNRMVLHLWELQGINFDYYFFDENCSYRLLELLEIARPSLELTDDFGLTAIPIDTIKAINQAGLINDTLYRPSQVTKLNAQLNLMSNPELELLEEIIKNPAYANQTSFKKLPPNKQHTIIDSAYRYTRYQQLGKAKNKDSAKQSFQLLASLNKLPNKPIEHDIALPIRPEKGHDSRRVSIGIKERKNNLYGTLSLKMAFHSLEDNLQGYLSGAQINIVNADIRIHSQTGNTQIDKLDFVDIFSLSPRTRFFKSLSWRIRTGFERQFINTEDKLVAQVNGGGGYAYSILNKTTIYLLGTARLERAQETQSYIIEPALGIATGLLRNFESSTARIEFNIDQFLNGTYRSKIAYKHIFVLTRNQAIELQASGEKHSKNKFIGASMNYQYFF